MVKEAELNAGGSMKERKPSKLARKVLRGAIQRDRKKAYKFGKKSKGEGMVGWGC